MEMKFTKEGRLPFLPFDAMNPIFEFLHGKEFTYDGIHGHFEWTIRRNRYLNRYEEDLYFNPSPEGKRTKEYQKMRESLGDDWGICLTNAIETYVEIAISLGYKD